MSRPADRSHIAARLLQLVDDLSARSAAVSRAQTAHVDEALARGEETIDLVMRVPRSARDASIELGTLLDAADEFCRDGDLLTLATPPGL